jgi:hypothetical protein
MMSYMTCTKDGEKDIYKMAKIREWKTRDHHQFTLVGKGIPVAYQNGPLVAQGRAPLISGH